MEPITSTIMLNIARNLLGVDSSPAVESNIQSTHSPAAYHFEHSRNAARSLHGTGRMAKATEHAGAAHYTASRNLFGEQRREAARGQMIKMSA